jgi:hypothetical protein
VLRGTGEYAQAGKNIDMVESSHMRPVSDKREGEQEVGIGVGARIEAIQMVTKELQSLKMPQ